MEKYSLGRLITDIGLIQKEDDLIFRILVYTTLYFDDIFVIIDPFGINLQCKLG